MEHVSNYELKSHSIKSLELLSEEKLEFSVEEIRVETPPPPKILLSHSTKNVFGTECVMECSNCHDKQREDRRQMIHGGKALDKCNDVNNALTNLELLQESLHPVKKHHSYHNEEQCNTHSYDGLSRSLHTDNDARTAISFSEIENGENSAYWRERFFIHEEYPFLHCHENNLLSEKSVFKQVTNSTSKGNGVVDWLKYNGQRNIKLIAWEHERNPEDSKVTATISCTENNNVNFTHRTVHGESDWIKEARFQKVKRDGNASSESNQNKAICKRYAQIKRLERFAENKCLKFGNAHEASDKKETKNSIELMGRMKTKRLVSVQVARELLDNTESNESCCLRTIKNIKDIHLLRCESKYSQFMCAEFDYKGTITFC